MGWRWRVWLLTALMAAAAASALGAYRSVRARPEPELPAEIYESLLRGAEKPAYVLRAKAGYVAVCPAQRSGARETLTGIELSTLRAADRAMLRRGIPAASRRSLLLLLEDLGS